MEEVLKEANLDCTEVLDRTPVSILVVDRHGDIVFAN